MKIRNGFVSNSSSSSFVVINGSNLEVPKTKWHDLYIVGEGGVVEFGWGPDTITGFDSKANFAYLQILYANNRYDWLQMLEEVIKEGLGVSRVMYDLSLNCGFKNEGYIDHQSSASEGENTEIFENKDVLRDFLFGTGSYIELDNDNN
jgi:hypothetical protein